MKPSLAWILAAVVLFAACRDTRPATSPEPRRTRVSVPPSPDAGTGPRVAERVSPRARAQVLEVTGNPLIQAGDHVDLLATLTSPQHQGPVTVAMAQNLVALARLPGGRIVLLVLPEEAEMLALARRLGSVWVGRRHPGDPDVGVPATGTTLTWTSLVTGERLSNAREHRMAGFQRGLTTPAGVPPKGAREVLVPLPVADVVRAGDHVDVLATFPDPIAGDRVTVTLVEDVVVSRCVAGQVALLVGPEEAAILVHAATIGQLDATVRRPGDASRVEHRSRMTRSVVLTGERASVSPTLEATAAVRQRIEILRRIEIPRPAAARR